MKTNIQIQCIDQTLMITNEPIVASGGVNEDTVTFDFCPLWDGLVKTAVFFADRKPEDIYEVVLSEDSCVIPHEVLSDEGVLNIGVRGMSDDVVIRTTHIVKYKIVKGAPRGTNTSEEPTPDAYQQMLILTANAEQSAAEAKESAENAENLVSDAEEAAKNAANAAQTAAEAAGSAETHAANAEAVAQSVRDDANAGRFDGMTPFIGDDGNWWIGDTDTGVKAAGDDGKDGAIVVATAVGGTALISNIALIAWTLIKKKRLF